jgi:hypothetical protein
VAFGCSSRLAEGGVMASAATQTKPVESAYALELKRLRLSLALNSLANISEELRSTAEIFSDVPFEDLAAEAEKAVRYFDQAKRSVMALLEAV